MDLSKRTLDTDAGLEQFAYELFQAFTDKPLLMQTTLISTGLTGDIEEQVMERVVRKGSGMSIMLKDDFILLITSQDPEVQWESETKVTIIDGDIKTTLWVAP